jgi:hypothetical protein
MCGLWQHRSVMMWQPNGVCGSVQQPQGYHQACTCVYSIKVSDIMVRSMQTTGMMYQVCCSVQVEGKGTHKQLQLALTGSTAGC